MENEQTTVETIETNDSSTIEDFYEEQEKATNNIAGKAAAGALAALTVAGGIAWAKREVIKAKVSARRKKNLQKKNEKLAKKMADNQVKLNNLDKQLEETKTEK